MLVHSLDTMQEWCEKIFTNVPKRDLVQPAAEPDYEVSPIDQMSKVVKYIPVNEMSSVMFTFALRQHARPQRTSP